VPKGLPFRDGGRRLWLVAQDADRVILQNKANFTGAGVDVSFCSKEDYEDLCVLAGWKNKANQSQYSPAESGNGTDGTS